MFKLNVGCSEKGLLGFINIDLVEPSWVGDADWQPETCQFLQHDVTDGLPFEDNTCEYIVAHHFLEHLPYPLGAIFLCECYRVLAPGGVLTLVCPDFEHVVSEYVADPTSLRKWAGLLLYPQEQGGVEWHKAAYDGALLIKQAEAAGFTAERAPIGSVPYAEPHEWQVAVRCTKGEAA